MDAATLQVLIRETPLEVLTRAASLVARCDTTDSASSRKPNKRTMSPELECQKSIAIITTSTFATNKCRRLREEGSPVDRCGAFDDDDVDDNKKRHIDDGGRKSASTQTAFSSFVPLSGYYCHPDSNSIQKDTVAEEEPCLILDLDKQTVKPINPRLVSTSRMNLPAGGSEFENTSLPLNLTVSIPSRIHTLTNHQMMPYSWPVMSPSSCAQVMTSGIQQTTSLNCNVVRSESERCSRRSLVQVRPESSNLQSHETGSRSFEKRLVTKKSDQPQMDTIQRNYAIVEMDPIVDEHFRRSLGNKYSRFVSSSNLPGYNPGSNVYPRDFGQSRDHGQSHDRGQSNLVNLGTELAVSTRTRSITGAVDEHFAKSLGATWTRMRTETPGAVPSHLPGNASAVDDHFAKALGDTWFKLKAEKGSS